MQSRQQYQGPERRQTQQQYDGDERRKAPIFEEPSEDESLEAREGVDEEQEHMEQDVRQRDDTQ